jgi:Haem-NO-binding
VKGIIFNLVEDAVIAEHGEDTWALILEEAGAAGGYTALGTYPDEELAALVDAGSAVIGVPAAELTRGLGQMALLGLAHSYPQFFQGFGSTRAFLLALNDVIRAEVGKLHADAHPPELWFDELAESGLLVHYRSDRRLCALAEGMISGAASYFGETLRLTQAQCTLDGADHCPSRPGSRRRLYR